MTPGRRDWLDALAWRSAGGTIGTARTPGAASAPTSDERFSRATAVKLAVAGAASISLGLWKAAPVLAQDRGACFTQCLDSHDKELRRRLQSCDDVFRPGVYNTPPLSWARISWMIPVRAAWMGAGNALNGICHHKAKNEVADAKNDCYERCEDTCRQRSLQSSSGRSSATCEVTPPPHAPPPKMPPPPPSPAYADECANCAQVGGACCAGNDPTHLCACANPDLGCKRYGCD